MMHPYKCEKCGHRNYVTREDLDGERAALADAAIGNTVEQMRRESARLATLENPRPEDYGRMQGLLARRAAEISAPFFRKLAAIKKKCQ